MQMGNQSSINRPFTMPSGHSACTPDGGSAAADRSIVLSPFSAHQRYPQALIRLCNWDYDSPGRHHPPQVDYIGFCRREPSAVMAAEPAAVVSILRCCSPTCRRSGWRALYTAPGRVDLAAFFTLSALFICWEQRDTWAWTTCCRRAGYSDRR